MRPWPIELPETFSSSTAELLASLVATDTDSTLGEQFDDLAFASNLVHDDEALRVYLRAGADATTVSARKLRYLLIAFPQLYIRGITESLVHPEWYTVCFSATCTNASMWSVYADEHRGAALMFRPDLTPEGLPLLPLTGATGYSSVAIGETFNRQFTQGPIKSALRAVNYTAQAPTIDFFRFIGRLSRPKVIATWYSDRDGNLSPLARTVTDDDKTWRAQLWASFDEMATTKLNDWAHEQEYRIVIPDILGIRREHRMLRYPFSSLAGIVFGMRASDADKAEVVRQLAGKCDREERRDFAFYQMRYHPRRGGLVMLPCLHRASGA